MESLRGFPVCSISGGFYYMYYHQVLISKILVKAYGKSPALSNKHVRRINMKDPPRINEGRKERKVTQMINKMAEKLVIKCQYTCQPCKRRLRSTILSHMTASAAWKLFNRRHRLKRKTPKQRNSSEVEAWTTVFLVLTLLVVPVLPVLFCSWTLLLWFLVGGFNCTWGRWLFSTLTKWMPLLWSICGTARVNGGRTDDLAVRSVGSK